MQIEFRQALQFAQVNQPRSLDFRAAKRKGGKLVHILQMDQPFVAYLGKIQIKPLEIRKPRQMSQPFVANRRAPLQIKPLQPLHFADITQAFFGDEGGRQFQKRQML